MTRPELSTLKPSSLSLASRSRQTFSLIKIRRGRAIRQQAREVLAQRLIVSNNRLVALRRAEFVHYVVYS
jgi:hypothetical protein